MIELEIQGLEQAQARLGRLLEDVGPQGLEGIMAKATLRAHRYASIVVHVDTGRLKNSLFPRTHRRGNEVYGVVGTNVVYAPVEHGRGGEHAFFQRTINEDGPGITAMVEREIAMAAQRAGE